MKQKITIPSRDKKNYDRISNLPGRVHEEIEDTSFKPILTHSTLHRLQDSRGP